MRVTLVAQPTSVPGVPERVFGQLLEASPRLAIPRRDAPVLLAATRNAAEALGRSDDLGAIAPGRIADIIAVRGSPLQDVTILQDVGFVMKDGVVYKRDGAPVAGR